MPRKKQTAFDLAVAALKRNPKAEFAPLRDAAKKKRLVLYPVVYGRAKLYLGLVTAKKRSQGKGARKKKATARRSTTRSRPAASSGNGVASLGAVVDQIKELEQDRKRLREALTKISDVLDGTLG